MVRLVIWDVIETIVTSLQLMRLCVFVNNLIWNVCIDLNDFVVILLMQTCVLSSNQPSPILIDSIMRTTVIIQSNIELVILSKWSLKFLIPVQCGYYLQPIMVPIFLYTKDQTTRNEFKLEIVDQWSTRIPPPHRRGWHCSKSQGNDFESDIADNR